MSRKWDGIKVRTPSYDSICLSVDFTSPSPAFYFFNQTPLQPRPLIPTSSKHSMTTTTATMLESVERFASLQDKVLVLSAQNESMSKEALRLSNSCATQKLLLEELEVEFTSFKAGFFHYQKQKDEEVDCLREQLFGRDVSKATLIPEFSWGYFQKTEVNDERVFLTSPSQIQPLSLCGGTLKAGESEEDGCPQIAVFHYQSLSDDKYFIENIGESTVILGDSDGRFNIAYAERKEVIDGTLISFGMTGTHAYVFCAVRHSKTLPQKSINDFVHFDANEPNLGTGSVGTVSKAKFMASGEIVAVKRVDRRGAHFHYDWDAEVDVMRVLGTHPRLVDLKYVLDEGPYTFLVLEFVDGGDLGAYLNRRGCLDAAELKHLAQQLAEGIEFMHSRGVTHRDLKPGNILCMTNPSTGLTDFKISDLESQVLVGR
ncbi:kinase-like protein [Rhizoclosmatium globosum]|uniref:non-specific serine/threonine protein kinase n=1 Tax=Rhizoclosmatium globosum TaxID=329046 RepID=A0A1Y2C0U7_9FUNG|nr:kinase-like protein [Rhizoclosmatium globosum]|eukprot:ORY39935.1 kinase-like protein [Rhizoclosmatium globosum]